VHNAPNEPRAVAVSGASAPQERDQAPNEREKSVDLLVAGTQDHDAGVLGRWIAFVNEIWPPWDTEIWPPCG